MKIIGVAAEQMEALSMLRVIGSATRKPTMQNIIITRRDTRNELVKTWVCTMRRCLYLYAHIKVQNGAKCAMRRAANNTMAHASDNGEYEIDVAGHCNGKHGVCDGRMEGKELGGNVSCGHEVWIAHGRDEACVVVRRGVDNHKEQCCIDDMQTRDTVMPMPAAAISVAMVSSVRHMAAVASMSVI